MKEKLRAIYTKGDRERKGGREREREREKHKEKAKGIKVIRNGDFSCRINKHQKSVYKHDTNINGDECVTDT